MRLEDVIGNTPLVAIPRLTAGMPGRVLLKLEYLNPLGSLKDRIARHMLNEAEERGEITPGCHLIEVSSGNAGVSLASLCAARGYQLTVVMPETMSLERRTLLLLFGAEVVLTPAALGLRGAIAKLRELLAANPGLYYLNQGENAANPEAHEHSAAEIWRDTAGELHTLVLGAGTGGLYHGMQRFFRSSPERTHVQLIAVEPEESAVLSGGNEGPHGIQGIGAGVIVPHLSLTSFDGIISVSTAEAIQTARLLMRYEGIPAGISTGATLAATLRLAAQPQYQGRLIVSMVASSVERYLSTELAATEREKARTLPTATLSASSLADLEKATNPFVRGYRTTANKNLDKTS